MNLTTLLRVLVILEILLTAGGVTAEHFLESWKHAPWIYLVTQGAGLILLLLLGPTVLTAIGTALDTAGSIVSGLILGLVYFSPLRERFGGRTETAAIR